MIKCWCCIIATAKTLEESIAAIDKQRDELWTKRRAKLLRVQSLKLESMSYHLSVIILPLGRSP